MVCRYSDEHIDALRRHYGLNDKQIQFFTVHAVADQEHTEMAREVIARQAQTERQEELVRQAAAYMVRFKLAKFEGIYNTYQ
jgi:pyrroloquinoline quinone (PQQ) biosynthesis protein C